jgi:hypothetical protein
MKSKLLLLLACMALMFAFSGTVLANGPPPRENEESPNISDPAVVERLADDLFDAILGGDGTPVWEEWDEKTQKAVIGHVEVSATIESGSGDSSGTVSDSSSGCDTHNRSLVSRVSKKVRLWEYKSSTYWCWDGTKITIDPDRDRYAYEYQSFVKFVRHTHTIENGGRGELTHYDYTRGHFKSCLSPFKRICPFNFYPWIEKQQEYDGDKWGRVGEG